MNQNTRSRLLAGLLLIVSINSVMACSWHLVTFPSKGELHLSSSISVNGELARLHQQGDEIYYYGFQGPTALKYKGQVIPGQGADYHAHGFGNPVGKLRSVTINGELSSIKGDPELLLAEGALKHGDEVKITYESGVVVAGQFDRLQGVGDKQLVVTFKEGQCLVTGPDQSVLFDPSWGIYDLLPKAQMTQFTP